MTVQLLFRMFSFLKPVKKIAIIAGTIVVIRVAAEVLAVYFLSPAVTTLANGIRSHGHSSLLEWFMGDDASATQLRQILLWMAATQIFLGLMIFLRSVWDTKLSMHAVYYLRSQVYDRLQRVKLTFYDRLTSGQLINRALTDLQAVRNFVNMSLLSTLDILASLVFYIGLLFYRSPWLAVAALIPLPFWSLAIRRFSQKAQPLLQAQQDTSDKVMNCLTENILGVHVVRAFATEEQEIQKYDTLSDKLLSLLNKSVGLNARLTPTLQLIGTFAHIGLFVFSAWLIQRKLIHVGDLMLLGATMAVLLTKLQQINQVVDAFQKATVSAKRLFEILDLETSVQEKAKQSSIQIPEGTIEFKNVNFSYGTNQVLKNISAKIKGGSVTALVGPTGSGKSTLAGLIARFYDPESGSISIDQQDLANVNIRELRHHIGYVFQDTFLFSQSVKDNIRYGRKDVSDEMVKKAAEIAHADQFIQSLPNGYDTLLGERGVMLSGGQRQRLALARALVYDPKILILDDATAALDPMTERLVFDRLDPIFKGRTVLMIAHRLSSVEAANHVLVMQAGQIIQSGTHDELCAADGHYRNIMRMQLITEEGNPLKEGTLG